MLNCNILGSKFKPQSHHYVPFQNNTLWKGMNPYIPSAMGLMSPLLFFCKDTFSIKYFMKVDMPLNKETKPNVNLVAWGCRICWMHLCRGYPSPTWVLDMTQNHLMVRLQVWSFEKYKVLFYCHYSQVYSDPKW